MARTPGRYGRRAPKRARALKLRNYLTGIVPAVPDAEDYLIAMRGGWQVLGNDQAGDCVAVTWANVRRLVTTTLTALSSYPTQDQVWQVYRTQNPGFDPGGGSRTGPGSPDDNGMDIQTLLEYLASDGGPDGVRAVSFAQVDHTSPAEVKAAIALFGYVWTGVNVLQVNQQEFGSGQPWDYSPVSPVDGGHSVITGGYGVPGAGPLGGDERFITWGAETSFTDAYWTNCVEECWVVIWPEHLASASFLAGIDVQQLAADYTALTGRPFPASVTPPKPAPALSPGLAQEIIAKVEEVLSWLKGLL
jgi:hypothetical protein